MGFVPEHWGPHVWGAIHILAMGAPPMITEELREHYARFYNTLPHLLPCAVCGNHLAENLKVLPVEPHLDGRESLFEWTVQLHNLVNGHLGKPEITPDEAFEHWKRVCLGEDKDCKKRSKSFWAWVVFMAAVMVAIALYAFFGRRGGKVFSR